MAKKILIGVGALLLIMIVFLPELSRLAAIQAFSHKEAGWSQPLAKNAAMLNMRFWRYGGAGGIYKRSIELWPAADWIGDAHYNLALCYEKAKMTKDAVAAYDVFMARYPQHRWVNQAAKRKANLLAVQ
jgi:outer membrane protein assembly factor BamD (BamD/ComL family)